MQAYMEMIMSIIGETLCFIEMEETRVYRMEIIPGNEAIEFIANLQEGSFFQCDECGVLLFFTWGMQDRLGYDYFNNGCFYCTPCDKKLVEEEFGHRHATDWDSDYVEF